MSEKLRASIKTIFLMIGKIMFFIIAFMLFNYGIGIITRIFIRIEVLQQVIFLIALLLATKLSMFLFEKKMLLDIGLRFSSRSLREIGIGIVLPLIMLSVVFFVSFLTGLVSVSYVRSELVIQNILIAIPYYILVGMNEEILFRGYIFQRLYDGAGKYFTVIFLSSLFGFAHLLNPHIDVFSTFNIFLAGVLFSIAYIKTNSLWLPISLHFSWNYIQGMIYGFPVSGRAPFQSWIEVTSIGPEWITGGYFGPEGGAIVTVLLIICSLVLIYNKKLLQVSI